LQSTRHAAQTSRCLGTRFESLASGITRCGSWAWDYCC